MQQWERGTVALDAPIERYLPWARLADDPRDSVPITLRGAGDARNVVVKEGASEGRHCVIIDDLVQSGGTLAESAKAVLVLSLNRAQSPSSSSS